MFRRVGAARILPLPPRAARVRPRRLGPAVPVPLEIRGENPHGPMGSRIHAAGFPKAAAKPAGIGPRGLAGDRGHPEVGTQVHHFAPRQRDSLTRVPGSEATGPGSGPDQVR